MAAIENLPGSPDPMSLEPRFVLPNRIIGPDKPCSDLGEQRFVLPNRIIGPDKLCSAVGERRLRLPNGFSSRGRTSPSHT